MGTQTSKPKTLLPDKFKVLVKTNINLPKKGNCKTTSSINHTIEDMGSAYRGSLSHYLIVESIKITKLKPFSFELE